LDLCQVHHAPVPAAIRQGLKSAELPKKYVFLIGIIPVMKNENEKKNLHHQPDH
jgi:hypothetical protein